MPELTGTKDLHAYLRMFWRWKWLFLSFVVAVPVIVYVIERGQPKVYPSSALVGINSTTVNTPLLNGGGSFSTSNVTAIAELVRTTPVADLAGGLLSPPGNPGQIASEVSATGDPATNFLTITAQDRSPARAAAIANAFAHAISRNLQQSAVAQIDSTIKGIRAQLAHLGRNNTTRPQLQQQLNQLVASRSVQGGEAAILQPATPSASATGLGVRRAVELGLVIGLLLAIGAVVLAESADRRLRVPDELERMTGLPLLAAIQSSAFSGDLTTSPQDDEAFQMLRTALMYFNVDRDLDSIVITSAGEKDGKTTVATRLALTTAGAGLDVALVDADLRRAQVSSRLKLNGREGLGAVLAGTLSVEDSLVEYPLEGPGAGRLRVLPAGPPPPNPSALMSSEAMRRALAELEAHTDLVILDTPAALAVSDPLPLMQSVSGVVLIARLNRSTRQTIRRLQKVIESAHGNVLGVVATGASSGPGYDHYYPKYYAHNGSNGDGDHSRLRWRRGQTAKPTDSTSIAD